MHRGRRRGRVATRAVARGVAGGHRDLEADHRDVPRGRFDHAEHPRGPRGGVVRHGGGPQGDLRCASQGDRGLVQPVQELPCAACEKLAERPPRCCAHADAEPNGVVQRRVLQLAHRALQAVQVVPAPRGRRAGPVRPLRLAVVVLQLQRLHVQLVPLQLGDLLPVPHREPRAALLPVPPVRGLAAGENKPPACQGDARLFRKHLAVRLAVGHRSSQGGLLPGRRCPDKAARHQVPADLDG